MTETTSFWAADALEQCRPIWEAMARRKPPHDLCRLVIAARRVLDVGHAGDEFRELDAAVESFSERVPYDNEY